MARYKKGLGYAYFAQNRKRKRPIAEATPATNFFLVCVHELYPEYTINQLRQLITDRSKYILEPEAVAVLDAYIRIGEGDIIPRWR